MCATWLSPASISRPFSCAALDSPAVAYIQIGQRRPLPGVLPDRLLEPLLAVDLWMHHGPASRACSVTMADGTVHARVHVTVVDEFDDAWAAGFGQLSQERAVPVGDIATIESSTDALPAELAMKAMHGEEWRMGAYRCAGSGARQS